MNLSSLLRATLRRWYITVPGLLLTALVVVAAHAFVQPSFTRSADVMLVPAPAAVPKGANPYLYIGDLGQAADVLVTAAGSQSSTSAILEGAAASTVTIARDVGTSGPVILITVETPTSAQAGVLLDRSISAVRSTLAKVQTDEHLKRSEMITMSTLSVDTVSTPKTKTQLMATAGAGVLGVAATLVLVSLIDGLLLARASREARRTWATRPFEDRGKSLPDPMPKTLLLSDHDIAHVVGSPRL